MEFVAIDFETANETRASACSCGIAVVADGKVVDKRHWLIQPKELRFNSYNVRIHGIDRDAVANQPRFCELWEEIRPYLDGRIVLAHNASFDMSVLRNALDGYKIDYPRLEYSCTYLISRQTWSDWACFALSAVAYKLKIDFSHHDAAEDARACAEVALMAVKHLGATSFDDLEDRTSVYRGRLERNGYCTPYHPGRRGDQSTRFSTPIRYKDMKPQCGDIDESNPFFGRKVVFTGTLHSMGREEAAQCVVNYGGRCTDSVSKKTNIVVIGELDPRTFAEGMSTTGKAAMAESLASDGHDIEILSEDDFLRMIEE